MKNWWHNACPPSGALWLKGCRRDGRRKLGENWTLVHRAPQVPNPRGIYVFSACGASLASWSIIVDRAAGGVRREMMLQSVVRKHGASAQVCLV